MSPSLWTGSPRLRRQILPSRSRMVKTPITLVALVLLVSPAWAVTWPTLGPGCTLRWDAYVTPDPAKPVLGMRLRLTRDGKDMPYVDMPPGTTSITCTKAGVTTKGLWGATVYAFFHGEDSLPSNTVYWHLDKVAPGTSKNLRIK
jgi:hypothetical protein